MQTPILATYMRGGTSKGTFFNLADLPKPCQVAGQARDAFLLRVVGSPASYGKQIDGLGAIHFSKFAASPKTHFPKFQ
ncbi:AcnD-accessory protein PrpF [Mannheimia sp. USDA-ARS-USMARC-1261]|uniref:PrpF domain-containing protein n=1 Tax=Mannheimia sp. USDA-ARS-USMARC-1261 TaxID=1432056 RepID=UPI0003E3C690|nr:PrpF domain-containing protein [Mannheimia sp. USDA-ARS-USMARC-1261]AHG72659.1 AcnD-accessory protein PrpF [Mannheimia sp. USDA-ARS-USMARC-1261]